MNGYDEGYGRSRGRGPSWADPYGGGPGPRRGDGGDRPWVGGYREGYQGGSGGYQVGGAGGSGYGGPGYGGDFRGGPRQGGGYGGDFRPRGGGGGYGRDFGPRGGRGGQSGEDLWYLGERAYPRGASYDEAYRDFDRQNHPRISPVGGMYHATGGDYAYRRPPRPLREETWFSDWTRWF